MMCDRIHLGLTLLAALLLRRCSGHTHLVCVSTEKGFCAGPWDDVCPWRRDTCVRDGITVSPCQVDLTRPWEPVQNTESVPLGETNTGPPQFDGFKEKKYSPRYDEFEFQTPQCLGEGDTMTNSLNFERNRDGTSMSVALTEIDYEIPRLFSSG